MNAEPCKPARWRMHILRGAECLLLAGGIAALLYCANAGVQARAASHAAAMFAARANSPADSVTAAEPGPSNDAQNRHAPYNVIGRIQIPALGLSAPITNGVGRVELIEGVGHIPGTAVAGGLGTMALAGHRDTFFRSLRRIAPGMQIRVTGDDGTYRYQVDSTRIVFPRQVDVLETGSQPKLVLVTCYPFHYIGAAPWRFIVQAHLISLIPDTGRE